MERTKQTESLLARFMAAETTEQEERQLAEYFRTATDIPDEWRPYAEMFQIFDEGTTQLTESELETCSDKGKVIHLGTRLQKWAAVLIFMISFGAMAATFTYRMVTPKTVEEEPISQPQATQSTPNKKEINTQVQEEAHLAEEITFNNQSLADIAKHITAIYGCKVVFADKEAANLRLYFILPKGSTVGDFVKIIDEYETLSATINDNVITIQKALSRG